MGYPSRIYCTEKDKALMWDCWQKVESPNAIAGHFGRSHSSIQGIMSRSGGVGPGEAAQALTVINVLIKHTHKLPRELYKSLTWDRGKEMGGHKRFSLATGIDVYFYDPQHPWQRGSAEQINGLLRQYFPKGMNPSSVHQNRLNAVARQPSERPGET